jgi:hypothetical protein
MVPMYLHSDILRMATGARCKKRASNFLFTFFANGAVASNPPTHTKASFTSQEYMNRGRR